MGFHTKAITDQTNASRKVMECQWMSWNEELLFEENVLSLEHLKAVDYRNGTRQEKSDSGGQLQNHSELVSHGQPLNWKSQAG